MNEPIKTPATTENQVSESLALDIQRAQAAEARMIPDKRAKAPKGNVRFSWVDPLKDIADRMNIPPEYAPFWGVREKHADYISQGYIPVIDKGSQVTWNSLNLYRRRREITDAQNRRAVELSESRLKGSEGDADAKAAGLIDEESVEVSKRRG